MRGPHVVAWTKSLMTEGRSLLWPLAAEARYGDLGTGHTAPVSQALTVEQRVAEEDVLKADDGSDGKANSIALPPSPSLSPSLSLQAGMQGCRMLLSCMLYVSTGLIPIFPPTWSMAAASTGDCTYSIV